MIHSFAMAVHGDLLKCLPNIRSPSAGEKVYKDECVFSFDTPESETGLYVCMNTFLGFGRKHVERHYQKTGNAVFLHLRRIKHELKDDKGSGDEKKPTRLAIGLEGGFDVDHGKKYEYEEQNSIVILPNFTQIQLPDAGLPEQVTVAVSAILAAESASKIEEDQAMAGTWDGEKRKVTKHAESLKQLDNGVKVPPRGWKCEMCDKTDNLWLNLTDGKILCGRKFFDGSGGNNHAVQYFKETGYPLVVKLGTITPEGADVYSYDEDDMVEDPDLAKHLSHFGINIAQMEKTDKSMIELEIAANERVGEWAVIQEAGSQLVPLYGSGYTGLANLGNSCYLSSVMQVLFSIPNFQERYFEPAERIFNSAPADPTQDFNVQMAKLAHGLLSGDYSKTPTDDNQGNADSEVQPGIKPSMFKSVVGKGHPEFSTKRQQDAQEFFLHTVNLLERNNRGQDNPAECFKFQVEERIQCMSSKKVKYTTRTDYLLSLTIPLEAATNADEVAAYERNKAELEAKGEKMDPSDCVRPHIPLSACLEAFRATETVCDFYSSAINAKSIAQKTTRLRTFPDYLLVHLKKFAIGNDWVPKKLDVLVDVPMELDLSSLRGNGLQPGEEELPEPRPEQLSQSPEFEYDTTVLAQLCDMGFPIDSCKRALYNTQNSGVEPATNWIMEHMSDPDFADPFTPSLSRSESENSFSPNQEALTMIMSMGFTKAQAAQALKATNNNLERAGDWIFNHPDELDASSIDVANAPGPHFQDGSEKYRLVAFISHMGTSSMVGHYVCHILREQHWVIYNDNKVARSEHLPKDLAYLYLYRRV